METTLYIAFEGSGNLSQAPLMYIESESYVKICYSAIFGSILLYKHGCTIIISIYRNKEVFL